MPRFYLLFFITFTFHVTGGIELDSVYTDTNFALTCTDLGWSWTVNWYRDGVLVVTSHLLWSPYFTEKHFEDRTEVYTSRKIHRITVTYDEDDSAAYWNCCRWIWITKVCSTSCCVPGKTGPCLDNGTAPTDDPDEALHFNATLKLTSNPGLISEGQLMTLICTISNEIDEDKWFVLWIRNDTPVFITGHSSLSIAENLTDEMFSNINVTTDAIQQKVVIPVSSSLIGWSLWNCANPYVANLSNTLILEVMAKTTQSNKTSSTTYIIAGSVGGVVVLLLIVVMVMIVLRMRRRKEKRSADASYESTKEDIVMEDNVLYEGSKDNTRQNSGYLDDNLVIEDNVLYVSGNDAVSQEKGQKIPSGYE